MPTPLPPDRSTYIGSSDIAAILGVSKWQTAVQVWERKVFPEEWPETTAEQKRRFRRGQILEPYVVEYLKEQGYMITARNTRYTMSRCEVGCEIDAEEENFDGDETRNVEIKSVDPRAAQDWGEEGTDEIPVYYMAQVQFALWVTGRKQTIVAAAFGFDRVGVYIVDRDEKIIEHIAQAAGDFWDNYVVPKVSPPVTNGEDADRWLTRFNGRTVTADAETLELLHGYVKMKEQAKLAEGIADAAADVLKAKFTELPGSLTGDQSVALVDANGKPLLTWNQQSSTRVDLKATKEAFPNQQYVEATNTFRVLRLKEKNIAALE